MRFENLKVLWLLALITPGLLLFFWWSWRKRAWLLTQFIQARLLPDLTVGISPTRQKVRLACLTLSVVFLILTLARLQWGFDYENVPVKGLDIVVAIDTSKSMLAEDISPNRLARAKLAALDLMRLAKADRLGLVAFAGSAFLQCPLTIDDSAFRQSVESLDVNSIPQGGTAIAEAIGTALTAFKEGDNYKVLVLMTDGEDHDSGALKAAEEAAKAGMRIYTIGIGSKEGEVLRVRDATGKTDYVRDDKGNVVKSQLDEDLLKQIAGVAQGFYLPLRGAKTIETLYQNGLSSLPKAEHEEHLMRRYHEWYHLPLAIAVLFLITEMLFPERRREGKARAAGTSKTAVTTSTALVLLFFVARIAHASPSSALQEYGDGKYSEALKEYERLLQKRSDDPRLHFNAGAAAYRNKQFQEATNQFNQALATPDLKLQQQAYFNRGNALYRMGEQADDPKLKSAQWEQSMKDFEIANKLNQTDSDARFNYEYVKRKLEELKQQQQQQQQKNDKQDKKDDQKNQDQQKQNQQNQNNDQQKQDQKQDQQGQQNQDGQSKKDGQQDKKDQQQQQSSKQNDPGKPDQGQQSKKDEGKDQKEKQKPEGQKPGDKKEPPQQAGQPSDPPKDNPDDQQEQEAQAAAAGQMTPQQAKQLLEAQKGDEQLLTSKKDGKQLDVPRPAKDW